jgi:hypothetical protein
MASDVTLRLTGAFSVGQATNLNWDLPLVRSVSVNGYTQRVTSRSFTFDVPPDASQSVKVGGRSVRRFHWTAPPADTVIHVNESLHLLVRADLTPFRSAARYPLGAVPPDASSDLSITPLLQVPAWATPLLRRFQQ